MIGGRMALLAGLVLVPLIVLWLGHHLRDRGARGRGAFWGGLIGHSVGLLVTLTLAVTPPVWWAGGHVLRELAIHWAALLLALAGGALGAMRGVEPRIRARG